MMIEGVGENSRRMTDLQPNPITKFQYPWLLMYDAILIATKW